MAPKALRLAFKSHRNGGKRVPWIGPSDPLRAFPCGPVASILSKTALVARAGQHSLRAFRSMSLSFFRTPIPSKAEPQFAAPEGLCIYAVGDIHGCLDPLNRLLDVIERDSRARTARPHLVFLGDLVDRGPSSAQVIDRLMDAGNLPAERCDFVMGNHEEVMLDCYEGASSSAAMWLQYGGIETLESYGIDRSAIADQSFDLAGAMQDAIPESHIRFLRSFKDFMSLGDYLFVHAGIRPGVPLDEQAPGDLRWIRSGFLDSSSDHGRLVVHGHTIVPNVEFHPNRIAVDTGCYLTGELAAVAFEARGARVLTSKA